MSIYVCPTCGRTSHHPKDAEHRYCAVCGFEDRTGGSVARMSAADQAVRHAIGEVIGGWLDALPPGENFNMRLMMRDALVGAIKPLAEMARDWGMVGDTPESIGEGFRRTVAEIVRLEVELTGKPIGWVWKEALEKGVAPDET